MLTDEYRKKKLEEAYWRGVDKARQTGFFEEVLDGMADLASGFLPETDEYKAFKKGCDDFRKGKVK